MNAVKLLPDGRELWLGVLTFSRARLHIGSAGLGFYDDAW